jgi:hypothetical protein
VAESSSDSRNNPETAETTTQIQKQLFTLQVEEGNNNKKKTIL